MLAATGERVSGGGSGIRTHVTVSRKHAFQACAFSHSATPPDRAYLQAVSLYIETRDVRFCPSYLPDRLSKAAPSEKCVTASGLLRDSHSLPAWQMLISNKHIYVLISKIALQEVYCAKHTRIT